MDTSSTYPWLGLEGVWFVAVIAFAIWWLLVDYRIEAIANKSAIDIVGTTDRLTALLTERDG